LLKCDYLSGPFPDPKRTYSSSEIESLFNPTLRNVKDKLWWAIRFYNGSNAKSIIYANDICKKYHDALGI
jgi:hypothetical protein